MSTSSTGVRRGAGTTVRIGRGAGPTWTSLAGIEDSPFPDQTPDDEDVTCQLSPNDTEESIRGMKKVATWNLPLHYVPGSATDTLLTDLEEKGSDEVVVLEITPAGGASHQWVAYVNSYRATALSARGKQMAEAVFKVQSRLATVAASAPVNATLPAISGVAQVGVLLTAWPGLWQPTGAQAYQWQENDGGWVNISGATAQTYTPIVGEIGNPLRVIVTETNATGSTSAISAATANVIAA